MTISNNNNTKKTTKYSWHQVPKNCYVRRRRRLGKGKREKLHDKKWLPWRSGRTHGFNRISKKYTRYSLRFASGASPAFKSSRDHRWFLKVCKFFQLGNLQRDVDQRLQLHLNHPADYRKSTK